MTRREIEAAERALREKNKDLSPAESYSSVEAQELRCRDMINSCLCYGEDPEISPYVGKYRKTIGDIRVDELISEQREDFEKATVRKNVFTDDEGLSYNAIEWEDDVERE